LNTLITRYTETLDSLHKEETSDDEKVKSLHKWLKSSSIADDLNDDEEYFFFTALHIVKIHQKYSYLFNPMIDCSKMKYIINIWSPLIEELFYSIPNLRTKWRGTFFNLVSDDVDIKSKPNPSTKLEQINQRYYVEHDISDEMDKHDSEQDKHQTDKDKSVIEGKSILDDLVSRNVEPSPVPVLHMCGTELRMFKVSLVPQRLYAVHEMKPYYIVHTWEDFLHSSRPG
jgi:hypothetical protein